LDIDHGTPHKNNYFYNNFIWGASQQQLSLGDIKWMDGGQPPLPKVIFPPGDNAK
jgi:hypothetical protein